LSSGTYNYSLSNAEAVLAAFERVQIRAPEIRQEHMLTARRELNDLFVELSNRQVNLWSVQQLSINLVQGTATYSIPSNVVMILDAYRTLNNGTTSQTDSYIEPMSRTQWASIANKFTQGPPTSYWFDRTITPTVTPWPVPDGNGPYVLNYFACSQLQDASLPNGETPNLPYRWLGVMVAGLALRLARVYPPAGGDPIAFKADRKADYDDAWKWAAEQDTENVNFTIAPNISAYYNRGRGS
jgi:hypothetical protein